MQEMKFSNEHKTLRGDEISKLEMTIHEHAGLDEVLESFTEFLRGVGFVIDYDKRLDFVSDEDGSVDE